jgi:DNA-binding HxlR family transcriptional regulator
LAYPKFRAGQTNRQLPADTVYTLYFGCCSLIALGVEKAMPKKPSPPSVLEPQCPSRLVLDRIADKWTALVIQILARGTRRYAELQRAIGGISQKMLTQTLRSLERDGLVQRKVHPVVPPKVEYSLTRLGRTLIEPLHALCRWSERHLAELQANRARAKAAEPVAAVAGHD